MEGEHFKTVKLTNWGNSKGVRIPANMLHEIGILDNDNYELNARVSGNKIILEPKESKIDKLFKDFDYQKYQKEIRNKDGSLEQDWGKPQGKEFW